MNLKEAFTYANFLDELMKQARGYLVDINFITTTTETHMRLKANKDANDEEVVVQKPYDVSFTPNDVIDFVVKVLNEKERLSNAIAVAKDNAEINIDNAVAMNKQKQSFVIVLNTMAGIKASEKVTNGRDYKFDVNGEQKPYIYEIRSKKSIDFDRNDVKGLIKKYSKECDEVSAQLDKIIINTPVDFTPKFDSTDTFEDLVMAK